MITNVRNWKELYQKRPLYFYQHILNLFSIDFLQLKKKLNVFLSLIASPATSIPALIVPMYLLVCKFLQHKDHLTLAVPEELDNVYQD